jgi:hypothetical protein
VKGREHDRPGDAGGAGATQVGFQGAIVFHGAIIASPVPT